MIKLIASDLDGTLLHNGAQQLNPHIFDLILQLKGKGIRFVAASGRPYSNLRHLFAPVQNEISYIAENGSLCVHDGIVLSRGEIKRELGLSIFDAIDEFGRCDCFLSCESKAYTNTPNTAFFDHLKQELKYDIFHVDDLRSVEEQFLKIALWNKDGTKEMEQFFPQRFENEIKVVTSGNTWLDFIAPNAHKGTALSNLLTHLKLKPENCIAFGDQYNDAEMLQLAGTSYSMSTAAPGMAYYSTYVTNSVEEVLEDILSSVN